MELVKLRFSRVSSLKSQVMNVISNNLVAYIDSVIYKINKFIINICEWWNWRDICIKLNLVCSVVINATKQICVLVFENYFYLIKFQLLISKCWWSYLEPTMSFNVSKIFSNFVVMVLEIIKSAKSAWILMFYAFLTIFKHYVKIFSRFDLVNVHYKTNII